MDRLIGDVAERQHGVISRRQLLDAGVGRRSVERRVESGRLRVLHRGVYAVGHCALSDDGKRMAAVLATGPNSVLSYRSAAALWQLWSATHLEVSVPTARRRSGIQIHRARLPSDEMTSERGIPVTTVPRTLFDLAAVLPRPQVERAINEAEVRRLTDPLSLADFVERYPRRQGVASIRAILVAGATLTRSELEVRFLSFLQKAGLPRPQVNVPLLVAGRWIECDCVWRDSRVVVELDGLAAHGTAAAFERDRARDRTLNARGWRLIRVTWRQVHHEPEALAYDLRALLRSEGATAPSRRISQLPSDS